MVSLNSRAEGERVQRLAPPKTQEKEKLATAKPQGKEKFKRRVRSTAYLFL